MPSILKFTPLAGALTDGPLCYLLDLDGYRILLDCGWADTFDPALHAPLKRVARSINAVLVSHPDLAHLGALPYAYASLGLVCPVYATLPVFNMGQLVLYDAFFSKSKRQDFSVFSLDDIDGAFAPNRWVLLNYSQQYTLPSLPGKPAGITITPFPAGHLIGGTVWIISRETDVVVYAVQYNHSKEKHLNATTLETIERPGLLITDAGCMRVPSGPSKRRRDDLLETVIQTVTNGGNVLLPCDSAGRVLELALLLDQLWVHNKGNVRRLGCELALLTYVSYNTMNYAQTMTEWMGGDVVASGAVRESPYQLKHLRMCHSLHEVLQLPGPKVVLASMPTLEAGFAQDLFLQWASDARNAVLFTSRPPIGSVGAQLVGTPRPPQLSLKVSRRVPLEGPELAEHWRKEHKKKQAAQMAAALLRREADRQNLDESDSESDGSDAEEAGASTMDMRVDGAPKPPASNFGGFFKHTRSYPMFAMADQHRRFDDYGEEINADDFVEASAQPPPAPPPAPTARPDAPVRPVLPAAADAALEPPTKVVVQDVLVTVACRIHLLEVEGLADAVSAQTLIERVAPRKMILVDADADDTLRMKEALEKVPDFMAEVLTPKLKQILDVSSTANIIQVKMTEALFQSLRPVQKGDYELAFVEAQLVRNPDDEGNLLDLAQARIVGVGRPHHPDLFVGEVMLSQFKSILQREGFQAEFTNGLLVCNGEVAIRKVRRRQNFIAGREHAADPGVWGPAACIERAGDPGGPGGQTETGRLTLEGVLSKTYYDVRALLYQQYAIL